MIIARQAPPASQQVPSQRRGSTLDRFLQRPVSAEEQWKLAAEHCSRELEKVFYPKNKKKD